MMLDTDEQVQIVGEAADGLGGLNLVGELRPNVVLMDIRMPGMDGLEATSRIKSAYPATAVIMMTSYDDDSLIIDAVRAGAAGYLLKDVSRDLLLHSVRAVTSGGCLIRAPLLRKAINRLCSAQHPPLITAQESTYIEQLTQREEEVLKRIADGQTNKEIGDALALAEVTVKKHVQTVIAKLHASDRTQAATTALRIGLIR